MTTNEAAGSTPRDPEAVEATETSETLPARTPWGAIWRGGVVLAVLAVGGIPSAWAGGKLAAYEDELVMGGAFPIAAVVGVLVGLWLRARNPFLVASLLGTLFAAIGGANLLQYDYVSRRPPYLADGNWALYGAVSVALGAATAVVSIVWGTVSGYRHPRPQPPSKAPASHLPTSKAKPEVNASK
ncbi:hypothetical protein [Streptomyces sp. NPDC047525]|uniref:hypothetical protein n=1 Tax=Streptomyces sp. NPDC047525 TaxID=3155264 RepID=UPI0033ECC11C